VICQANHKEIPPAAEATQKKQLNFDIAVRQKQEFSCNNLSFGVNAVAPPQVSQSKSRKRAMP